MISTPKKETLNLIRQGSTMQEKGKVLVVLCCIVLNCIAESPRHRFVETDADALTVIATDNLIMIIIKKITTL